MACQFFPISETEIPRNQVRIEQPCGCAFEFLDKDSRLSGGDNFTQVGAVFAPCTSCFVSDTEKEAQRSERKGTYMCNRFMLGLTLI